jgi:hypothetical protein
MLAEIPASGASSALSSGVCSVIVTTLLAIMFGQGLHACIDQVHVTKYKSYASEAGKPA